MLHIGCHLSSSKGYLAMARQTAALGADTFQYFTRNPRGSRAKAVDMEDIAAYRACLAEHPMAPVVAHAPYTLNACAEDESLRAFAARVMAEDLATLDLLPDMLYNFHPGCHVGRGPEAGIRDITAALNEVLTAEGKTPVLLETMSGKGSEVGASFEELAEILAGVVHNERVGICLDTCHVYSAGYDVVNDLDGVLTRFDRVLGLDRLKALHLNDSMTPFGSRKDRHEKIGQGSLGEEAFVRLINHPALRGLPFELETPNELPGYAGEIAWLRTRSKED